MDSLCSVGAYLARKLKRIITKKTPRSRATGSRESSRMFERHEIKERSMQQKRIQRRVTGEKVVDQNFSDEDVWVAEMMKMNL